MPSVWSIARVETKVVAVEISTSNYRLSEREVFLRSRSCCRLGDGEDEPCELAVVVFGELTWEERD
jgi:hypothetical protein